GNGYITTRLVDQTGLKGAWDFDVKWNPRYSVVQPGVAFTTMFAALEQQLDLKLSLQDVPAPVLVIDNVNEAPTPNPSGVDAALPPPPPTEFDVADIKVAPLDMPTTGRLQPGGRLDFQGYTMKQLVTLAWDISDDDLLAGAPAWFTTTKYSIVAKASEAAGDQGFNFDDLRLMVRALLIERFKITTHVEDRPVEAYALLVADKPKLQPADPAHRSKCQDAAAAPGQKDPREANPILNVWKICQNVTMAEFAQDLSVLAPSYLREPVVDATGLAGAWDLTLSWSAYNIVHAAAPGDGGAGGTLGASAPSGALSLFDALQKQLGLKLELRKRPMPVLVIDHINEQPSDN
ncbi:MAG TPA: TIGR03435 family protein, partial [Gemmatimonadaceae bacterium]|nr:TIGR03435 family protein [Gemmatimonadaceae bacterium]